MVKKYEKFLSKCMNVSYTFSNQHIELVFFATEIFNLQLIISSMKYYTTYKMSYVQFDFCQFSFWSIRDFHFGQFATFVLDESLLFLLSRIAFNNNLTIVTVFLWVSCFLTQSNLKCPYDGKKLLQKQSFEIYPFKSIIKCRLQ